MPPIELSAEDREDLTPEELNALMSHNEDETEAGGQAQATTTTTTPEAEEVDEEALAAQADKPVPTAEEIAAAAEVAAKAAATATASEKAVEKTDETPSAEELAALLEEENAPAPAAPKPVTYKGITEADYKTEAAKLNVEKAAAMKDLMDGTIDAEAYAAIESAVAEKRDDLVANRTLARANQEAAEHANAVKAADFAQSIAALMKSSSGQTIDYNKDAKAQAQFDNATRLVASDPDNVNLTPQQVCDEAHRMVLALRGVAATPAAAPTPPAAKKEPATKTSPPPTTLAGLPAAAPNATGNDLRAQFAQLEGEEAEEFLERLPEKTREALMNGVAV